MNIRSTLSSSKFALITALFLIANPLLGASQKYVAFFSAEQENYRRIMLDGVGNRHVSVDLDTLGRVEVRIWGVTEQDYVGLRNYFRGYLIPVNISVNFPENKVMSIVLTGSRFKDLVRYREIASGLYIIDLYTDHLPQESIFREKTIGALWPGGRFQPDVSPAVSGTQNVQKASSTEFSIPAFIKAKIAPYRFAIQRAMYWAGAFFIIIVTAAVPLLLIQRNLQTARLRPATHSRRKDKPNRFDRTVQAQNMMSKNGSISFEEASLLADLEQDGLSRV